MYSPRLTKEGMWQNKYWYSSEYNFSGTDLLLPNCTCYALGRTQELSPHNIKKEMFNGVIPNAVNWFSDQYVNWKKGSTAKLGAVAVWGGTYGHVAVVEEINDDGTILVSQSNYETKKDYNSPNYFQTRTYKCEVGKVTTGVGLVFLGYIYNPYVEEDANDNLIKIDLDDAYEYKFSLDGAKYGTQYAVTTMAGHYDEKLKAEGWEEVVATNGGLFYAYGGTYYANGLEKSCGVNNQDINMTAVSDYSNAMAIGLNNDITFAKQSYIVNNLDNYYGAVTGIGVLLGGKACEYGHKEFASQYNTISGRTIWGESQDGKTKYIYCIKGTTGSSGLYGKDLANKCLELGMYNAICLDGGGSVWMRQNGNKNIIVTSRKTKNAVLLYRIKKDTPSEDYKKLYEELKTKYDDLEKITQEQSKTITELQTKLETTKKSLQEIIEKLG